MLIEAIALFVAVALVVVLDQLMVKTLAEELLLLLGLPLTVDFPLVSMMLL